ncbi:MAG: glycosyltransferase [Chloroflexi bacterium]|nr:glycosyltransferase [Chloroflexota bacterium]
MARWRSANWTRYHQLLIALCQKGHQVFILEPPALASSEETNYTDLDIKLPEGMVVHEIRVPLWDTRLPLEKLAKKMLATIATKHVLQDFIKQYAIDVLLLYNFPQYVLARGTPCLTVFDIADDLIAMFDHEVGQAWRPILHGIAEGLQNRLIQASHLVTTPSVVLAEQLSNRVVVLPNGADWEAAQKADGSQIRERYKTPIVGFLGAFEYFVDFDLVLAAAEALQDVTFLLVGTGRSWKTIRAQVEARSLTNVSLPGPVPYPRGLNYVAAMDICLIPLNKKTPVSDGACPLKLFEYAALKKPIISTSTSEVVIIGEDFATFADTPSELTKAIKRLLDCPDGAQVLTARGLELVQSRYRWDVISDQFLELVEAAQSSKSLASLPQLF